MKGYEIKHVKSVFLKNGRLSTSEEDRQARWQEHFCDLYKGRIATGSEQLSTKSAQPLPLGVLDVGVQSTQEHINKLGSNPVGPDGISALLLNAGDCPVAVSVNVLQRRTFGKECWPVA